MLHVTRHTSHVTRHTSRVMRRNSVPIIINDLFRRHGPLQASATNVTCHMSHVTCHTSYITHHTSHITHHTSHIIHYTSHITHHTSHITHHTPTAAHSAPAPDLVLKPPSQQKHEQIEHVHLVPELQQQRVTCHVSRVNPSTTNKLQRPPTCAKYSFNPSAFMALSSSTR